MSILSPWGPEQAGRRGWGSPSRGIANECTAIWVSHSSPTTLSSGVTSTGHRGRPGGGSPHAAPPCPTYRAPRAPHIPPLLRGEDLSVGGNARGCIHPRDPKSPLPSPCPGLCKPLPAALPRACRVSVRISLSFLPRTEQLIIYPVIKEETVNEMKTSQKHLLGLLSSPPRAACTGSSGRGPGALVGAAAAGGCPPHPAFLTWAPSSSGTPWLPRFGTLFLLHHQSPAETCWFWVTNSAGVPAGGMSLQHGQ